MPTASRLLAFLTLFWLGQKAAAQDVRSSPSGDVFFLHAVKKGATLGLPFQTMPFRHNYLGFSNGIFKDKHGFLWIGRRFGAQRFDGYEWRFFETPYDDRAIRAYFGRKSQAEREAESWKRDYFIRIEDFRIGSDGQIWLSSAGDVFSFNEEKQAFEKRIAREKLAEKGIAATDFFKIKPVGDSLLWFYGQTPGLFRYHLKTGEIDDFSKGSASNFWEPRDALVPDGIPDFFEDGKGQLWATGSAPVSGDRHRLHSLDLATKNWRRHAFPGRFFDQNRGDEWAIQHDIMMWDFCEDSSDSLVWVSGLELGLCCFHKNSNRWQQFYLDLQPGAGAEPSRNGGDAEPWADSLILQAVDDRLLAFHKKERGFYAFDSLAGLPLREPIRIFRSPSGDVFVTSMFALFELKNPKKEAQPLAVWFSKIRANGAEKLENPSREVAPFSLFETERTVEIELFALPFEMPNQLEYRYKTSDFWAKWIDLGEKRSIRLDGLAGQIGLEAQARQPNEAWSASSFLSFEVVVPFWKRGWFRGAAAAVLVGFFYGLFWFQKRRAQREQLFRQRLAEAESAGIRSQISPAFLAENLAAIERFLSQNEAEKAAAHLSKFSKLMRRALDDAGESSVVLSHEIETLELFLGLEKSRSGGDFDFLIEAAAAIDADDELVAPLVAQRFLETVLEEMRAEPSDLAGKKTGGELRVFFSKTSDGRLLIEAGEKGRAPEALKIGL